MNEPILWSAVNISEGRDLEKLGVLASTLDESKVDLADWSADPDHHRSVFTLVGSAPALSQGIEILFAWAAEHIDISRHQGVHPRLGAVDVVPFVPLSSTADMEEAREVAARVACTIAERFHIPAFLYRDSSRTTDQRTLPDLRRGGLDALALRMNEGTMRPDFGPLIPHPRLGVSVFGARPPLTAFNCLLDTRDLDAGRAIARELRASNGGVPHLQALAFQLPSQHHRVQISMNILNPKETPPHIAYLAVQQASQKRGYEIVKSELIGLLPVEALRQAFKHFLKLESFKPAQVAEWNLLHHQIEGILDT